MANDIDGKGRGLNPGGGAETAAASISRRILGALKSPSAAISALRQAAPSLWKLPETVWPPILRHRRVQTLSVARAWPRTITRALVGTTGAL